MTILNCCWTHTSQPGKIAPREEPRRPVMRYLLAVPILCCAPILTSPAAAAEPQGEDLADRVRVSIEQGVKFLRDYEAGRGYWGDLNEIGGHPHPGGWTGLA